ncbi:hypothetical protein RvY_10467 [Ramazzottius varieornatus]|uniref:Uncharacterized protein n=1 Tax=Ramazzottius varieornatus TaxID=947166 RepID=A0A1D1VI75_RAMVA|nr:hypothetical protein RvY_10467 [Ramazzottius varieornatus]
MENPAQEPSEAAPAIDEKVETSTPQADSPTLMKSAKQAIEDPSSVSLSLPGVASRFSSIGGSDSILRSESRGSPGSRRESQEATKREASGTAGPRRSSLTQRGSLSPGADTQGIFARRGRRGSAFRQQDTPKEIPDKTFSTLFEVLSNQCRNYNKSTEVVFLACLKLLKKLHELGNIQIVFEDYDVPQRMLHEFLCMTVDTPFDNFDDQNEQISDLREVAHAFIQRTVQVCLKLSALHKAPEDILKEQGMLQVRKLFPHPDHLNILVDSNAFHTPQSYIGLCEGTLQLDGLGDDFEWAYPTAPADINT